LESESGENPTAAGFGAVQKHKNKYPIYKQAQAQGKTAIISPFPKKIKTKYFGRTGNNITPCQKLKIKLLWQNWQ
jgi:hypothetical protein